LLVGVQRDRVGDGIDPGLLQLAAGAHVVAVGIEDDARIELGQRGHAGLLSVW
jgi:hypothetical protein